MARPQRDNMKAAKALIDAAIQGDATACETHGITTRTLQRYRAALENDEELSLFYAQLSRTISTQSWADELNLTLTSAIRKQGEMIRGLKEHTAENINATTNAIKALSEIAITRDVLASGGDDDEPSDGDED